MIKTTSLQTSKLLKEAGFDKDTEFYFCEGNSYTDYEVICGTFGIVNKETIDKTLEACYEIHPLRTLKYYTAPTTDELLEELPKEINIGSDKYDFSIAIYDLSTIVHYEGHFSQNTYILNDKFIQCGWTCEALAHMWIYLKKQNLLINKVEGEKR